MVRSVTVVIDRIQDGSANALRQPMDRPIATAGAPQGFAGIAEVLTASSSSSLFHGDSLPTACDWSSRHRRHIDTFFPAFPSALHKAWRSFPGAAVADNRFQSGAASGVLHRAQRFQA
jgi:hypothetical protein